jgi:hypothetical protein
MFSSYEPSAETYMRILIALSLMMTAAIHAETRVPVLVELFTSEGCSSCPPADKLLADLSGTQPIKNADVIVLSEHVDYWNTLGWKDPFSSKAFSERQEFYSRVMGSSDIYTPQAIIDGRYSAVGSNRQNVLKALSSSSAMPKEELALAVKREGDGLRIDLAHAAKGDLWVAVAQSKAVSRISGGENDGRTLAHVGVVRSMVKVNGNQVHVALDRNWQGELKVVAFVQDAKSGRILQIARSAGL